MKELIIPDDGIIVKTQQGRTILKLELQKEEATFRMYDTSGNSKIGLGCDANKSFLFLGDANKNVTLSSFEDASEIWIQNSGKEITLVTTQEGSQIRFKNENKKITCSINNREDSGGRILLSDKEGNLKLIASTSEDGGKLLILNNYGNIVAIIEADDNKAGRITLGDYNEKPLVHINCFGGVGAIGLLDEEDNIVWTSIDK